MRSRFPSEPEAFRAVVAIALALSAVLLAAVLGPTWLAVALLAVVLAAAAIRVAQVRMRKLRGLELHVKMAPAHRGPADERRVLVVANDALGETALMEEMEALAAVPGTRVFVLVPALISPHARLTGAVDAPMDEARVRLASALRRVGHAGTLAGEVSDADPLQAVEDAFAAFAPDEVIVATARARGADTLEPRLAGVVRERFAVPVRHRIFEPGAAAQEPDSDGEARYREEFGKAAARRFGLRALTGVGLAVAVALSVAALIRSSERQEARAAARSASLMAWRPAVAKVVDLSIVAEYKRGPEGEKHDAYTVTEFAVHAGQPQLLRIDNTDSVPHSITAPEAGINIVAMPGVHTYTLVVKKPGTYVWFCGFVCDEWAMAHPGYMRGYITVT